MATVSFHHLSATSTLIPATPASKAAFAAIYEQYRPRLYRVALQIVKNDADAEDVVQESLLRAYTKIDGFRGEAGIYTWLVRIVINTSLMVLRKRSRRPVTSLDWEDENGHSLAETLAAPGDTAEADVIQQQTRDIMYSALMDLPSEFKTLILAWITQERSMPELSREFGISLPATKSRILRGKLKMAKTVKRRLNIGNYNAAVLSEGDESRQHSRALEPWWDD